MSILCATRLTQACTQASRVRASGSGKRAFVSYASWFILRVVLGCAWMALAVAASPPHLAFDAVLSPGERTLAVQGAVHIGAGEPLQLRLSAQSEIHAFRHDGRAIEPVREGSGPSALWRWRIGATAAPSTLRFRYTLRLQPLDPSLDHRQVLGLAQALVSADGAFLPDASVWYPQPDSGAITYRIGIDVPPGFRAVAAGQLAEEAISPARTRAVFESARPLPGIDLLAGPYLVGEKIVSLAQAGRVRVRTYFHAELQPYSQRYLDSAAEYLARYDRRIGEYAHPAYSIVSAPLPTGFGMPGIAYLGRQVIQLPFIPATSLGHEVLHEWWGNGVYPAYAHGNWSEGLTTFLADYAFKEEESSGAAHAMRLGWLRDYAAVPEANERPLAAFVSRRHGVDQAVGYNKAAFVFLMLRDALGEEAFNASLRSFWRQYRGRVAGWSDIERVFAAVANRDLRAFFQQWVQRIGAPSVRVVSARSTAEGRGTRLRVTLEQQMPHYRLRVLLRVRLTTGDSVDHAVMLESARAETDIVLPAKALWLELDPDVRLFRRLDADEIAPTLRQVMLDPRTRVVAGQEARMRSIARDLARAMFEHDPRFVDEGATAPGVPLLVVGITSQIATLLQTHALPQVPDALPAGAKSFAYAGRTRAGLNFAVVSAPDADSLAALSRPLPHLGGQSYAVFDGARSVARGVWPYAAPRIRIEEP